MPENWDEKIEGKITFVCAKSGKSNRWTRMAAPSPTPILSSNSSTAFKPLFSLNATPILTMTTWTQEPSYFIDGRIKRWNVTRGFVEISIPTFERINAEAEYFAVFDKNFAYNRWCMSGDVLLPFSLRKTSDLSSSKLEVRPDFKGASSDLPSFFMKIPSFPITFRCDFFEKKAYSLQIYETFTPARLIRATSPKIEFTTPEIDKPVEPSPQPTTLNTEIRAVPDAFCSPEGAIGTAADGTKYSCRKNSSDSTLRWTR